MKKTILIATLLIGSTFIGHSQGKSPSAEEIVNKAYEALGGDKFLKDYENELEIMDQQYTYTLYEIKDGGKILMNTGSYLANPNFQNIQNVLFRNFKKGEAATISYLLYGTNDIKNERYINVNNNYTVIDIDGNIDENQDNTKIVSTSTLLKSEAIIHDVVSFPKDVDVNVSKKSLNNKDVYSLSYVQITKNSIGNEITTKTERFYDINSGEPLSYLWIQTQPLSAYPDKLDIHKMNVSFQMLDPIKGIYKYTATHSIDSYTSSVEMEQKTSLFKNINEEEYKNNCFQQPSECYTKYFTLPKKPNSKDPQSNYQSMVKANNSIKKFQDNINASRKKGKHKK